MGNATRSIRNGRLVAAYHIWLLRTEDLPMQRFFMQGAVLVILAVIGTSAEAGWRSCCGNVRNA